MKKWACLLLCVAAVLALSGCWSRREPKDLAVVDSALFDVNSDGTYKVTVEILNPAGIGGTEMAPAGGKGPFMTISAEGKTVREAIVNLSQTRAKNDFGAHVMARFFSERFAEKDVASLMDLYSRETLFDERPLMIVFKGNNPEKIFNSMIGMMNAVGEYVDTLKENQPKNSADGVFVTTLDFINDYYAEGKEPVMGVVEVVESTDKPSGNTKVNPLDSRGQQDTANGSEKNYEIKYKGLAAFRGGAMVGFMDAAETRAYNFLINKVMTAYISVPSGDGEFTVLRVVSSVADVKTYTDGGDFTIDVNIKVITNISSEGDNTDISDPDTQKTVSKVFDRQLESEISKAVVKAQTEFGSDIFGFGRYVHIQHPDIWKLVKNDWNGYFAKALVNVSVDSSIGLTGEMERPFTMEGAHS